MNRLRVAIIIALIVFLAVSIRHSRERRAAETVAPPLHTTATPIARPPSQSGTATPRVTTPDPTAPGRTLPAPPSPRAGGGHSDPPPHAVPFELIHGLVVAYGDILLGRPTRADFPASGFIEAPALHLWPGGAVPFALDPSLPDPDRVRRVLEEFNRTGPVRFVPYSGQTDGIVFVPFSGLCLSYLGRIGGQQPVYLDDRCDDHEIAHELMHALGFIHEHSRPDRDMYVKINWNNIDEDKQSQFEKVPDSLAVATRGRPFDYRSIMLYSASAFALDRSRPSLESLTDRQIEPSDRGLSEEDHSRLNELYGSAGKNWNP